MEGPVLNPFMKTGHATILNGYGWLWLTRDGSPTLLTIKLYPKLLGENDTTDNRLALEAYLLGGENGIWCAHRHYAGVMHFVYLIRSEPNGFTSGQIVDVANLKLEPPFAEAMRQAFQPLGAYLNFWHPTVKTGETKDYTINLVNDEGRQRNGRVRLVFTDRNGRQAATQDTFFTLLPLGSQSYTVFLKAPDEPGSYSLQAIAKANDLSTDPSVSRRNVTIHPASLKR